VGYDKLDLPIGMQLMGPHFSEKLLFRLGHAYQLTTDWHTRWPEADMILAINFTAKEETE